MEVGYKNKKISKTFFTGDMVNMIKDNFKPSGWDRYEDSPYAKYTRKMEELGYVGAGHNKEDS
jgi:hypothetical protein